MRCSSLAAVILLSGCALVSPQKRGTVDLLQGRWEATYAQETHLWIFSGNELRMLIDSQAEYRGWFSIDDSRRPIRIDIDLDEYQNEQVVEPSAVRTKGILSIDGEILTVITGTELQDYPESPEPREGTVKLQFKRSAR